MKTRFLIPSYEKAFNQFLGEVIDHFLTLDPLLQRVPRVPVVHGGPTRNVLGQAPLDQEMTTLEGISNISNEEIRTTNFSAFTEFFMNFVSQFIEQISQDFFSSACAIATAAGATVDARGKPVSFDLISDMLESMHIDFADDGTPLIPTMILHPEAARRLVEERPTKEQELRRQQILEKKKAEFDAQKRTRRLSFTAY